MTLTLELSAEEAAALRSLADTAGVEVDAVLHSLIAQIIPAAQAETRQVEQNPDEDAERRREQEEVEANIKRWHAERKTNRP